MIMTVNASATQCCHPSTPISSPLSVVIFILCLAYPDATNFTRAARLKQGPHMGVDGSGPCTAERCQRCAKAVARAQNPAVPAHTCVSKLLVAQCCDHNMWRRILVMACH